MEKKFDRPTSASNFFEFVASEFYKIGSDERRFFLDKEKSGEFVQRLGFRIPKRYGVLNDISSLTAKDLHDSCVLKYGRGWSSQGVMLLERKRDGNYFDYMALESLSLDKIIDRQKKTHLKFGHEDKFWIIEEFLPSIYSCGRIPFDYKFYTFYGKVAVILQIDRNSTPPRIAIFDENFLPLEPGKDYILGTQEMQIGVPLIPYHATEMLKCAQILSQATRSPFVSIDLYDTPNGLVFGEFTFSPGGVHNRLQKYEHSWIDRFDEFFAAAKSAIAAQAFANPESSNSPETVSKPDVEKPLMDVWEYQTLSAFAYNAGTRGALRLADYFWQQEKIATDRDMRETYRFHKRAWAKVREFIIKSRNVQ